MSQSAFMKDLLARPQAFRMAFDNVEWTDMSVTAQTRRRTIRDIQSMKGQTPIVSLTAYTTPVARIVDRHCDVILVGDSLGMVIYGLDSTLGVTLEMMIRHAEAVVRGSTQALVVVDLPFGSYESSREQAFESASQIMAIGGVSAVKLEGGLHMSETVRFLVERGIPVMGHIGLTPQSVNTIGGYRVVGRRDEARKVLRDAQAIEDAGVFSVVLEKMPASLAEELTAMLAAPTIGIGASSTCDGQILVTDDMLGVFTDFQPKFVKRYAEFAETAEHAVKAYADDVREKAFPTDQHSFS